MEWGIFKYMFLYQKRTNKVSIISVFGAESYSCISYTKDELVLYSKWYAGICPLYSEALKYFPEEPDLGDKSNEQAPESKE